MCHAHATPWVVHQKHVIRDYFLENYVDALRVKSWNLTSWKSKATFSGVEIAVTKNFFLLRVQTIQTSYKRFDNFIVNNNNTQIMWFNTLTLVKCAKDENEQILRVHVLYFPYHWDEHLKLMCLILHAMKLKNKNLFCEPIRAGQIIHIYT